MPTELLMRNVALLAKVEATYGVDPVPAAANAILVSDVKLTPMNMRTVSRDLIRSFLGSSEQLPTEIYTGIEFTCELAGSGAAGTAPALGPLLRACGFAETINAGVSVVYAPVSTGFESLTFHANLDGVLHKGLGARGTVRLSLKNHDRPTARFMFQGIFVAVADAALPAVDLSAWQRPQPVNKTNTPGITLHGYSAPLSDLQIDVANQVQFKSFVGGTDFVQITDRSVTGNVLMQAVKVADKNWWTAISGATVAPLEMIHGTVAGNIVEIDAPNVQIHTPDYQDEDGIRMLSAQLALPPGATGNDELVLTFR